MRRSQRRLAADRDGAEQREETGGVGREADCADLDTAVGQEGPDPPDGGRGGEEVQVGVGRPAAARDLLEGDVCLDTAERPGKLVVINVDPGEIFINPMNRQRLVIHQILRLNF